MKKLGICLDTETTGLLLPRKTDLDLQPFITEIYLAKFDLETFKIVDEFETLVNVPIKIPEHITRITKIDNELVSGEPYFSEIALDIEKFCEEINLVVGQNLMFDLEVLRYNFLKYKLEKHFPNFPEKICTIEKSFPIFNKRVKLGELYEIATGKKLVGAHRARHDVQATLEVYKWLLKEEY